MRFGLNWLKDYVDCDLSARDLAILLTETLSEAEVVASGAGGVTGVVAAKLVTVDVHPDADGLSVCLVDWGEGSSTVVCGAPNARPGMVAALALPGATIGGGRVVGERTIRGRRSHGMLVSAAELGLEDASSGIVELAPNVELGSGVGDALGLDDEIIELDVQPNRPDCLGVVGIAREVAAMLGRELKYPRFELSEAGTPTSELTEVRIEAPDACPRYIARIVAGLTMGPSPDWLQARLRSAGLRSISNVVDVTNFVMLEFGHPIHAFDYSRLPERRIVVRRAEEGETLVTLDGEERVLTPENLLICDGGRPIALAGLIGGAATEVGPETRDVLLECAWFNPAVVRRGAARLQVRTEASHRFERGVDPGAMGLVAARACALMAELGGGDVAPGPVDAGVGSPALRRVALGLRGVRGMLGPIVDRAAITESLGRLGFTVEPHGSAEDSLSVVVPSHRSDIEVEADLIEEIARAYGYDNIEPELPFQSLEASTDEGRAGRARVRDAMVGLGFHEVLTTSFMRVGALEDLGIDPPRGAPPELLNPVNKEMPLLRTSMLPGVLDVVRRNRSVGEKDARIFEVGKVFLKEGAEYLEQWSFAGAMVGEASRPGWGHDARPVDFHDGKGVLWGLAEALKVDTMEACCYDCPMLEAGRAARLRIAGADVGFCGMLSGDVVKSWDLPEQVFVFELELDGVLDGIAAMGTFEELPRYPSVRRDIAIVLDEQTPAGDVFGEIQAVGEPLLARADVFDVYRGKQVPDGKKSLGFSLTYVSRERTLTDEEVDQVHSRVVERLLDAFGATLRE